MFKRFSIIFVSILLNSNLYAISCVDYKIKPDVFLNKPDWVKSVVQPISPMDLYHGNVIATLIDDYDILVDVDKVKDGYCVYLKSVDAVIGYNNFVVSIDIRNKPQSCQYNGVLLHENKHINAYLSIIDEKYDDIKNAVFNASDSIMPVFVKNKQDAVFVIEDFNIKLRSHPELILIKQKILSQENIKNKQIDEKEDYSYLHSVLSTITQNCKKE